ncbi:MAG TPA: DUF6797 domain-containing protein, partial [Roseimicrobium sp.]|nr:DUF6797 domain-containing protein [Roseimicrobium sp.]
MRTYQVWASSLLLGIIALADSQSFAAQPKTIDSAPFVEPGYPFFSSVLDARKLGQGWPANNLTPRGIILNLGNDCWACFDVDLLRMSAIWTGKAVTPVSMAQVSYYTVGEKAPEGQKKLPQIIGTPWIANGIYPGWQSGNEIQLADPRDPGLDAREVGRGPLPSGQGQFNSVRLAGNGVCLEYTIAGTSVQEWVEARLEEGKPVVQRRFRVGPSSKPLILLAGSRPKELEQGLGIALTSDLVDGKPAAEWMAREDGLFAVRVQSGQKPIELRMAMGLQSKVSNWPASADQKPAIRWTETVTTSGKRSTSKDAYVVDDIPVPQVNPWKRQVRVADIAFFKNGAAAVVTFDGDVWLAGRFDDTLEKIVWKRFATGLHEPLSLVIRNGELFVYDRNGIWRLRDTDGNGEADAHELFCNLFAQTAETRDFAASMRLAPDGSFVISKGGQQGDTLGKNNGMVLRIAPDGKSMEVLGWGLREPFVGVHPRTGLVTASDQQGNYVPSTPLHIIKDRQYYGFLTGFQPKEQYPSTIADPLTWIPHPINASGAGQVWATDVRMGPLRESLLHIGYYRPEVFLVRMQERAARPQAFVVSLTRDLEFSPLTGVMNPWDGQVYVAGFQIWGTVANRPGGIARIRYTGGENPFPREVVAMDKGILLRFDSALDPATGLNTGNYSIERWNYKRTPAYGSPHFKTDGSKGQESMSPSSVYLSKDGTAVFIGIPDMKPVMQMRLGWAIAAKSGLPLKQNAYFTPYDLIAFNPRVEGFDAITVDLKPRAMAAVDATPVTVEEGQRLAELMGCVACHSNDGSTLGKVGPSWKGIFGSQRLIANGPAVLGDEAYIRESIQEPTARIVKGFDKSDTGMPSYDGVITDAQIEALIL